MRRFLLAAAVAACGDVLAAADPVNPHGVGKEGTPVEREFFLSPPADPPLTQAMPQRPARGTEIDVWAVVRAVLPWTKMI